MATKRTPKPCRQEYHESLSVNILRFLSSTEYVGIQEAIATEQPKAMGNCRKCSAPLAFIVSPRQIEQLQGQKVQRDGARAKLSAKAARMILTLARERTQASDRTLWGYRNVTPGPKHTYRDIGQKLVELKLADRQPDPAIIRRIVLAAGIER